MRVSMVMTAAGLTPSVQFGEFCWWYFPAANGAGMAFYDTDTQSGALAALDTQRHDRRRRLGRDRGHDA